MPFDSIFRAGLFAGQTHVVTGAGSGIGRCTAHELASLGATVVLVGRKPDKLERVRDEIADAGGEHERRLATVRDSPVVWQIPVRWHGHHFVVDVGLRVDIGTVVQQHLGNIGMLLGHRPHQGRLAARAVCVRTGALGEQ